MSDFCRLLIGPDNISGSKLFATFMIFQDFFFYVFTLYLATWTHISQLSQNVVLDLLNQNWPVLYNA